MTAPARAKRSATPKPWIPETKEVIVWPVETFGQRLRLIRHQLGYSLQQFADLIGEDDGNLSNWESGKFGCRRRPEVAATVARETGAHRDWLLYGDAFRQKQDRLKLVNGTAKPKKHTQPPLVAALVDGRG